MQLTLSLLEKRREGEGHVGRVRQERDLIIATINGNERDKTWFKRIQVTIQVSSTLQRETITLLFLSGTMGMEMPPPNPIILLHHAPLILLYLHVLECTSIVQIGSCHWVIDTYYLFNVLR